MSFGKWIRKLINIELKFVLIMDRTERDLGLVLKKIFSLELFSFENFILLLGFH